MYKVFYNEKALILTDKPVEKYKSLKYVTNNQFDEALDMLKNSNNEVINIYHHNLSKLWNNFQNHFKYLEAAGGVVKNQKDKILFIHRLGRWDLPKGKVENGETTEIAAVREVEEECGITNLKITNQLSTTYHIYYQNEYILKATYWYEMDYMGNEELIPQKEEGIKMAQWKDREEILKIFPETYENIQLILKEVGLSN